ncbi:hypothetical protein [Marinivivus vitaminiproducens]|uniref:hypothetical protein n=1 Tax=Marinivivus vitaminiproducens TaxID=3035935 RepID=UPI0027A399A8|nr:hypothetical protein P4R82_16740 [Geminicoccaceae bacterium SCSIO 64248]
MVRTAAAVVLILAAFVVAVLYAWHSVPTAAHLDWTAVMALVLGSVLTCGLAALLIFLLIYSDRKGYDQRAHDEMERRFSRPPGPDA